MNLEEPSKAIRRMSWILNGFNKYDKVGREKYVMFSKIYRLEQGSRKKSVVIFWVWKIQEMMQWQW